MKKGILTIALLLAAAMALTACAGGTTSSSAKSEPQSAAAQSAESEVNVADTGALGVEMLYQEYGTSEETSIDYAIEVPQMTGSSPAIEEINAAILEFAGDYELKEDASSASDDFFQSLQLKAYPQTGDDYAQIVMTRVAYPNYGTQGEIASFLYDIKNDAVLSPADVMEQNGIDEEELRQRVENWEGLYEGDTVTDVSFAAARFVENGCEVYIHYFFKNAEATDGNAILIYNSADDRLYPFNQGYPIIDPAELDHLNPPLWYDQEGQQVPDVTGEWTSMTDLVLNGELTFQEDGTVMYRDSGGVEHEGTYTLHRAVILYQFEDLGELTGLILDEDELTMPNDIGGSYLYDRM
ncbi:hypothetical protein LJC49_09825 [Ruminococcaceae bacterium OttesenSCG-928-I18]|nr:hypothetical protein [Ruminococcaceae bacterium OttesenSCG-928-I18]